MSDHAEIAAATAEVIRRRGSESVSFRSVSEASGIPLTTIQYRLKSKERLLSEGWHAVVEEDCSSLFAIERWIPERLDTSAIVDIMAMCAGLSGGNRAESRPAIAELLMRSVRQPQLRPIALSWFAAMTRFWLRVAEASGKRADFAHFLAEVQLGLTAFSTNLLQEGLLQLVNRDVARRLLSQQLDFEPLWYRQALAEARRLEPQPTSQGTSEGYERVLTAVVKLCRTAGPAAVTYQRIATLTSLSVSAVAHHFPSRKLLLHAGYRRMQAELFNISDALNSGNFHNYDVDVACEIATYPGDGSLPLFVAYAESELLALHDPDFVNLALSLRMSRGRPIYADKERSIEASLEQRFETFSVSIWLCGCVIRHIFGPQSNGRAALMKSIDFGFRATGLLNN